jgi:hypothetical protein
MESCKVDTSTARTLERWDRLRQMEADGVARPVGIPGRAQSLSLAALVAGTVVVTLVLHRCADGATL